MSSTTEEQKVETVRKRGRLQGRWLGLLLIGGVIGSYGIFVLARMATRQLGHEPSDFDLIMASGALPGLFSVFFFVLWQMDKDRS